MRVAHIITRMIVGGAQENTLLNCQDLIRDYGDEVLLITGPALGPEGDLLEQERSAGRQGRAGHLPPVELIDSLRRAIHPWRDFRSYQMLKSVLRRFRPDVVHTHSAKGGFLGRLAAWSVGVPAVVHTVHGAPFHPYQGRLPRSLFRWCERMAARRCHRLVSVADAMTDLMVDAGVAPRSKFQTVYSGMRVEPLLQADQHRQAYRRQLGLDKTHVVVGKIARLFHLKGHQYLVEAASQVAQRAPHVRFLLIGDGILRQSLEQRIRELGLQKYFLFTGLVEPSEIPRWIGAMDILVHTSLREGLARALPQALIAGKPVVSYDVDGAREVVRPGETGMLLPPKSIQPLAEALIQLVQDPPLCRQLGQRGRSLFTDQFRHQTMTRTLREIYGQLLDARSIESGG